MKSFIPFIIIGICVGMYFIYVKPALSTISVKQAKLEEYQGVLNRVKDVKAKRDELASKFNSISPDDLSKLNKMIPEKFVSEYFVNDVNAMSARSGMRITQIEVNTPAQPEGVTGEAQVGDSKYITITSRFDISGRFDQFLAFLKDMESSLRLIDVISLSAKSKGSEKGKAVDDTMDFTVEVMTYALK